MNISGNEAIVRKRHPEEIASQPPIAVVSLNSPVRKTAESIENTPAVSPAPSLTKPEAKQLLQRFEPLAPILQKALEETQTLRRGFQDLSLSVKSVSPISETPFSGSVNRAKIIPINQGLTEGKLNNSFSSKGVESPIEKPVSLPREVQNQNPPTSVTERPALPKMEPPLRAAAPHPALTIPPVSVPTKTIQPPLAVSQESKERPISLFKFTPPVTTAENNIFPQGTTAKVQRGTPIETPPLKSLGVTPGSSRLSEISTKVETPNRPETIHGVQVTRQPLHTQPIQAERLSTPQVSLNKEERIEVPMIGQPNSPLTVSQSQEARDRKPTSISLPNIPALPKINAQREVPLTPQPVLRPAISPISGNSSSASLEIGTQTAKPMVIPAAGGEVSPAAIRERDFLAFQRRIRQQQPQVFVSEARLAFQNQQTHPSNAVLPLEQIAGRPRNIGLLEGLLARPENVARTASHGDNRSQVPNVNGPEARIQANENVNRPRLTPVVGTAPVPPLTNLNQLRRPLPTNVRSRLVSLGTVNILDLVL